MESQLSEAMPEESFPGRSRSQIAVVKEALENFGLLEKEIDVYLYLAETGPEIAKDISRAICVHRTETYRLLRHLEKKGLIFYTLGRPVRFGALPLEKAIDLLVETQKMKIQVLQKQKADLVNLWASMPKREVEQTKKGVFQKLQGAQQIILAANELVEKTGEQLRIFAPDTYLAELYYSGFFDKLKSLQNKLEVRLLTVNSQKSRYFIEKAKWLKEWSASEESQTLPCFIISDKNELLIAFSEEEETNELGHKKKPRKSAIWTNYPAIVLTFEMLFFKLSHPV